MKKALILILFAFNFSSKAQKLTPQIIYNSVNNYHPALVQNLLKIEEMQGKNTEMQSNFDTNFNANYFKRTKGYYDGDYLSTSISKPISALNAEFYTGFENGSQGHPVYDGQYITGGDGRISFGGKINLFRNSKIYENTIKMLNSEMNVEKSQIYYEAKRIDLLQIALVKYWNWISAGMQMHAYGKLLELSQKRQKAIETQVKHGDIARFYSIENQQYLLQRQNQLQQAQNKFSLASFELSLYFRTQDGTPIKIFPHHLPEKIPNVFMAVNLESDIQTATNINPALKILTLDSSQIKNEIKVARSLHLPQASINGSFNEYHDPINKTQQEGRTKLGIEIKMPLERRKAKGSTANLSAKKQQIQQQAILIQNQLMATVQSNINNIKATKTLLENTKNEFEIASHLTFLEKESVKQGNSDFFTLNLREQSQFQAKVKSIIFECQLNQFYINHSSVLMNTDTLFSHKHK